MIREAFLLYRKLLVSTGNNLWHQAVVRSTVSWLRKALSIPYTPASDSTVEGAEAGEANKQHHHMASGPPLRPLYDLSRPRIAAGLCQCMGAFPGRVRVLWSLWLYPIKIVVVLGALLYG